MVVEVYIPFISGCLGFQDWMKLFFWKNLRSVTSTWENEKRIAFEASRFCNWYFFTITYFTRKKMQMFPAKSIPISYYPPGKDHISTTSRHFWEDDFPNFWFSGICLIVSRKAFAGSLCWERFFRIFVSQDSHSSQSPAFVSPYTDYRPGAQVAGTCCWPMLSG